MFIGIVNRKQNLYINNFKFNIDSIEQFTLDYYDTSNKKFNLKIIMKNKTNQIICRIDEEKKI